MPARTGPAYLNYTPGNWVFYVDEGENLKCVIEVEEGLNPVPKSKTLASAKKIRPKPVILDGVDKSVACCLFKTDKSHVGGVKVEIDSDGKLAPSRLHLEFLQAGDHTPRSVDCGQNFGACVVPQGLLVVHWSDEDKPYLSRFDTHSIPPLGGDWLATHSYRLGLPGPDPDNPSNHSAALIVDPLADAGLRLVVVVRHSSRKLWICEYALGTDFKPTAALHYVFEPEHSIDSDRVEIHTGPDGQVHAAYYADGRPCIATRCTVKDDPQPRWEEQPIDELRRSRDNFDFRSDTSPDVTYEFGEPEEFESDEAQGLAALGIDMSDAKVDVERIVRVCTSAGDFVSNHQNRYFGSAWRKALPAVEVLDRQLIGVIEGAPPIPRQNLTIPGYNQILSTVQVVTSEGRKAETSIRSRKSVIISVSGQVLVGTEANLGVSAVGEASVNNTIRVGFAREFSLRAGFELVYGSVTSSQVTKTITQEFATPVLEDASSLPSLGSALLLSTQVIGYHYYFAPNRKVAGQNSMTDTIEYGPFFVNYIALNYDISKQVEFGRLSTYMDSERAAKISDLPRFNFASEPGEKVGFSWNSGGGSFKTTLQYSTEDYSSVETFIDITDLVGVAWKLESAVSASEGRILAGYEVDVTHSSSESSTETYSLDVDVQLAGDVSNPNSCQAYTFDVYHVAPPPADDRDACDKWIAELDIEVEGGFDKANSRPWKICYVVVDVDPENLDDLENEA